MLIRLICYPKLHTPYISAIDTRPVLKFWHVDQRPILDGSFDGMTERTLLGNYQGHSRMDTQSLCWQSGTKEWMPLVCLEALVACIMLASSPSHAQAK